MTNYQVELEWLDEGYVPQKVTHFTNHDGEMTPEQFDESQAKSYGYDSFEDMVARNFEKDNQTYLKYGDKAKGLI